MSDSHQHSPKEDIEIICIPDESKQINYSNQPDEFDLTEIMRTSLSDLIRYSETFREKVIREDMVNNITKHLELFLNSYNIQKESIKIFFRLLQNEKLEISNEQYCDLYRLSDHFQINPLIRILKGYFNRHHENIDFIIKLLVDQIATQNADQNDFITNFELTNDIEECLCKNIDECILNDNFGKLPLSTIYRLIEKSDTQQISSDLLFDFISKNIEERIILFLFLNVRNLTDEKFNSLYELFENTKKTKKNNFTDYLHIDLDYIKYIKDDNKQKKSQLLDKETKVDQLESQNQKLQNQFEEIKKKFDQLQSQNQELQKRLKEVEQERDNLKEHEKKFNDRIRSIIQSKNDVNDDFIFNIFENDFQFSHSIRNIFRNCSDKEIVGYVSKDTKFSSNIRGIFKSGDDSRIINQIEEYRNLLPQLKDQINKLEQEKKDLSSLSVDLKTQLHNLQSDNERLNDKHQNLQKQFHQLEQEKDKQISQLKDINQEISDKNTESQFEIVKLFIRQVPNINDISASGIFL